MSELPLPDKIGITAKLATKLNVITTKFGNGYEQRRADGINAITQTWQIEWLGLDEADKNLIIDEIESNIAGSFDWTPPHKSVEYKYKIEDYSVTFHTSSLYSIAANLVQVFDV